MIKWFADRLARTGDEVRKDERGFTLIELLVVVIIIGILAAIAIPTFLSQREGAQDSAAQSDLRNAGAAATACSADNDGSFSGCGSVDENGNLTFSGSDDNYGFNQSNNVSFDSVSPSDDSWSAQASHDSSSNSFQFSSASGQVSPVSN